MSQVSCICLAAGLSSRMKGDHKLLKAFGGSSQPLIAEVAFQLLGIAEAVADVTFVLGAESEAVRTAVESVSDRFCFVKNPDFAKGMHSSIRAAVLQLDSKIEAIAICLGDQPFDLQLRMENILKAEPIERSSLLRSKVGNKIGHPVLIGRDYFARILAHEDGDYGCSYLFKENTFEVVEQPESALLDLDTPEDFAKFVR